MPVYVRRRVTRRPRHWLPPVIPRFSLASAAVSASVAVYDMIPGNRHSGEFFLSEQGAVYQDFTSVTGVYIVDVVSLAEEVEWGVTPQLYFSIEEWAVDPDSPDDHQTLTSVTFDEPGSAVIVFEPGFRDKPYRLSYAETRGNVNFSVAFLILNGSDYPP